MDKLNICVKCKQLINVERKKEMEINAERGFATYFNIQFYNIISVVYVHMESKM